MTGLGRDAAHVQHLPLSTVSLGSVHGDVCLVGLSFSLLHSILVSTAAFVKSVILWPRRRPPTGTRHGVRGREGSQVVLGSDPLGRGGDGGVFV